MTANELLVILHELPGDAEIRFLEFEKENPLTESIPVNGSFYITFNGQNRQDAVYLTGFSNLE